MIYSSQVKKLKGKIKARRNDDKPDENIGSVWSDVKTKLKQKVTFTLIVVDGNVHVFNFIFQIIWEFSGLKLCF